MDLHANIQFQSDNRLPLLFVFAPWVRFNVCAGSTPGHGVEWVHSSWICHQSLPSIPSRRFLEQIDHELFDLVVRLVWTHQIASHKIHWHADTRSKHEPRASAEYTECNCAYIQVHKKAEKKTEMESTGRQLYTTYVALDHFPFFGFSIKWNSPTILVPGSTTGHSHKPRSKMLVDPWLVFCLFLRIVPHGMREGLH